MSNPSQFTRSANPERRVVVTGLSCISPLGLNADETWKNIVDGKSGIGRITQFDSSTYDSQIAGEVKGFNPDLYVAKKEQKKVDRFIQFAMASAQMALKDSGIEMTDSLSWRTGVLVGVGMGGLPIIEKQHQLLLERGPGRISPFFIPSVITNLAAGQISIMTGAKGPNYSVTSACASGSHSIGEALNYIRKGIADVMIAGGSESVVCGLGIGGFSAMKALSTRNDNPTAASRPWDRDRDGFVLAEGCGMLILEDFEHASRRGARIYAELSGYGASSDAYHMTSPAPGGVGAAWCMKSTLKDARVNANEISYINAHGTSTMVGDEIETQAVKAVFGDHAKKLWLSSTKSMTGHTLGAAGALESVFSILALHHKIAPPTINLENPSDDCDLDYVPLTAREGRFKHVLNNSFGFGGTNACLLFSQI